MKYIIGTLLAISLSGCYPDLEKSEKAQLYCQQFKMEAIFSSLTSHYSCVDKSKQIYKFSQDKLK